MNRARKVTFLPTASAVLRPDLNEILVNEAERRQAQTNFIETQALAQVERDRTWKEWEERVNSLNKQSEDHGTQSAGLGSDPTYNQTRPGNI